MLYTGFSQTELDEIIAILEANQIHFEVSANEQAIIQAQAIMASKFERGTHRKAEIDNSFYAISLNQEELIKVPPADLEKLINLRIFPGHTPVRKLMPEKKSESLSRTPQIMFVGNNPVTAVIIMLGLLCLAWAFFNLRS